MYLKYNGLLYPINYKSGKTWRDSPKLGELVKKGLSGR